MSNLDTTTTPQRPIIRPHFSDTPETSQAAQATVTEEPIAPTGDPKCPVDSKADVLPPPPPLPIVNEAHDREMARRNRPSFLSRLLRRQH